jgi:hypothetical protein
MELFSLEETSEREREVENEHVARSKQMECAAAARPLAA